MKTLRLFRRCIPAVYVPALFLCLPAVALATPFLFAQASPPISENLPALIAAVFTFLTPLIVYGIRLLKPGIPKSVLPILVYGLQYGLNYVNDLVANGGYDAVVVALLAGSSMAIWDIVKILSEDLAGKNISPK